jgi:hypothetical protein
MIAYSIEDITRIMHQDEMKESWNNWKYKKTSYTLKCSFYYFFDN